MIEYIRGTTSQPTIHSSSSSSSFGGWLAAAADVDVTPFLPLDISTDRPAVMHDDDDDGPLDAPKGDAFLFFRFFFSPFYPSSGALSLN